MEMDLDRATEELKVIRQLMERPIRFSTMSGLSAILAGLAALAGLVADWQIFLRCRATTAMWMNMAVWSGVFVVAFLAAVILTRVRELQRGMPVWSRVKKRVLLTILPPFVASVGLTLAIMYRWHAGDGPNEWGLIPAIWMLFYAVALWQLGEFSPVEVRLLGAVFLAGGLVTAVFFQASPYWALGLTFGGCHIVYGIIVWVRHGG